MLFRGTKLFQDQKGRGFERSTNNWGRLGGERMRSEDQETNR